MSGSEAYARRFTCAQIEHKILCAFHGAQKSPGYYANHLHMLRVALAKRQARGWK